MAYFIPSSIQKRLLRYALLKTGLLETEVLDLESLDIALGRQNKVELRDLGLNIKKLSNILQLPPELQLLTARIATLRLNVPADLYRACIVAQVEGVHLTCSYQLEDPESSTSEDKARHPNTTSDPSHRKTARRIRRPSAYDPGGSVGHSLDDDHVPNTEDLAQSFLHDGPMDEKRELEAIYNTQSRNLSGSSVSEASDEGAVGTGTGLGLPGFLAGFLQGIIDRFQIEVQDVTVKVDVGRGKVASTPGYDHPGSLFALHLSIKDIAVSGTGDLSRPSHNSSTGEDSDSSTLSAKRKISLDDIRLFLLDPGKQATDSPYTSRTAEVSPTLDQVSPTEFVESAESGQMAAAHSESPHRSPIGDDSDSQTGSSIAQLQASSVSRRDGVSLPDVLSSSAIVERSHYGDPNQAAATRHDDDIDELDIRPGEDNVSWNSRRSETGGSGSDHWSPPQQQEDMSESLFLDEQLLYNDGEAVETRMSRLSLSDDSNSPFAHARDRESLHSGQKAGQGGPHEIEASVIDGQLSAERSDVDVTAVAGSDEATRPKGHHAGSSDQSPESLPTSIHGYASSDSDAGAESMYMSALSAEDQSPDLRKLPGHWQSNDDIDEGPAASPTSKAFVEDEKESAASTPRVSIPQLLRHAGDFDDDSRVPVNHIGTPVHSVPVMVKQLVRVESVVLLLPFKAVDAPSTPVDQPRQTAQHRRTSASDPKQNSRNMPGAFSQYAEQSASVRFEISYVQETVASLPRSSSSTIGDDNVEIFVGPVVLDLDPATAQMFFTTAASAPKSASSASAISSTVEQPDSSRPGQPLSLHIRSLDISLHEQLSSMNLQSTTSQPSPVDQSEKLLELQTKDVKVHVERPNTSSKTSIEVGRCILYAGGQGLLVFKPDPTRSDILKESTPDIRLEINRPTRAIGEQTATQTGVYTRVMCFRLDVPALDMAMSSFGGLSGIMELSNSMMSSGSEPPKAASPVKKGVRFQEQDRESNKRSEIKLNARIGGFNACLVGKQSMVSLDTSAIKLIRRSDYVAASIDRIRIALPEPRTGAAKSQELVVMSNSRVEYLFSPRESDLDRLISLLTPSKNKYENDDEILIDTLLRQRRKGAVLRLDVTSIQASIRDWSFVDRGQELLGEVSKFSAVAKYLPEDDRPGLLTLVRMQGIRVEVPVNANVVKLDVQLGDIQMAHVGLPALLATAVGTVRVSLANGLHIVHSLVPVASNENLPMIMTRNIGDEVEPTFRIKVFNVCVEYSVPIFQALTGVATEVKAQEMVDLAASMIVELAENRGDAASSPSSTGQLSGKSPRKLGIDVLLQECGVGLQPVNTTSKGLLVFHGTRFTTSVPQDAVFDATLELRKTSLFITDQTREINDDTMLSLGKKPLSVRLPTLLGTQGYVSVTQIMSARLIIQVEESEDKKSRYVYLDVRDELFVLETCADSTKTLGEILGGLAPPSPPSKEPKFRTEAMTVQDMVSSFSGDDFQKPSVAGSTIFDASECPPLELGDDDEEDFLADAGLMESMYGAAADGLFDPTFDVEVQSIADAKMVESLLEEDPFEMPGSPTGHKLSDSELLESLRFQCGGKATTAPLELRPYYVTPEQIDQAHGPSLILGAPYRWNRSTAAPLTNNSSQRQPPLPLRIRMRDVHIIWNLYDGYDWQNTRTAISDAVEEVEAKAEERKMRRRRSIDPDEDDESVIGDFLFNSIYIGVPANRDPQELRREINREINDLASETESYATSSNSRPTTAQGAQSRAKVRTRRLRLERSRTHKIAFELKGVSADILVFTPGADEVQNSIDVRVRDFDIFDNVPTSTWRKFLTLAHDSYETREMCKPMVHLELLNVRPVLDLAATEVVMRVSLLPLRLHIDQDALDFMTRFFEFKSASATPVDDNAEKAFIQRIEINTVHLCLDYKPKKVDYGGLRSGKSTEFMNFFILDKANIILRHAIVYGVRGFDALHDTLNDIWAPDVKRNQLPRVLAGLAPVSSLVSIGTGFVDVVAIPIREYKKDGRLVRSIQKGAAHFARNTTSELARFGAKVAVGTQTVLQSAETMLSPPNATGRPGSSRRTSDHGWADVDTDNERETRTVSHYADQPLGVLQGLKSARRHLERDLLTARDALIAVQGEVLESGSAAGVAQAVARHAPTIVLRPVIGASRAVGQTLMGVGNQVDQGNVRRMEDKYKRR